MKCVRSYFLNLIILVFIATLGQTYYEHEEYLLSLGFELLSEYPNYRNGDKYKQRLYILVIINLCQIILKKYKNIDMVVVM